MLNRTTGLDLPSDTIRFDPIRFDSMRCDAMLCDAIHFFVLSLGARGNTAQMVCMTEYLVVLVTSRGFGKHLSVPQRMAKCLHVLATSRGFEKHLLLSVLQRTEVVYTSEVVIGRTSVVIALRVH